MSRKLFHEGWAIVGRVSPIDGNAANSATAAIDMSKWEEVCFIVQVGVIAASGTVDFKVQEGATSSPTTDMSGKAMTQLDANDDNKEVMIHVKAEELANGNRYIRGLFTNSAHSQLISCVALGRGKDLPASDDDLSTVDEIVI